MVTLVSLIFITLLIIKGSRMESIAPVGKFKYIGNFALCTAWISALGILII